MLGDRNAAARDDERGEGGEVVGAGAVAAGADDVDGVRGRLDRRHGRPHGLRRADDLLDAFAAHPQAHQKGAELRRRRFAVEDQRKSRARLVAGQRRAGREHGEIGFEVGHALCVSAPSLSPPRKSGRGDANDQRFAAPW